MYERFTDRACKVMQLACQEAMRLNHEYLGTEHILLGLIKEDAGVAVYVLKNLDIDLHKLRMEVGKILQPGPETVIMGKLPQTPRAKKVIECSIEEARSLNHNCVGTEHLLLGLLRHADNVAAQVLMNLGLKLEDVREETRLLLGITQEKEGWERRKQQRAKRQISENVVPEEQRNSPAKDDPALSADSARIRSLEQQLWNVRLVLGGLVGALAGALLRAQLGAVMGLILGGLIVALGWRTVGILAGSITGILLGYAHLPNDGGGLAGALLGALVGFLIAEIGRPSKRR